MYSCVKLAFLLSNYSSPPSLTNCSPGPVYYVSPSVTRNGKDGTPAYSLYGRSKTKGSTCSPGPG